MTHILRELEKPGSKSHKKEIVEPVTIIEAPPMFVVGLVGYKTTVRGLKSYKTVWAQHIGDAVKRRFVKNWYRSAKAAFRTHAKLYKKRAAGRKETMSMLMKKCDTIRVIAHSQPVKLRLRSKTADVLEIQVNGGSLKDKVTFAEGLFEKQIPVDHVFSQNDMIDIIAVTKGKGFKGVVSRWGVRKLPRKTHKGLRKVACIGAWHPSRVSYAVPRAGQKGYHHRILKNKKIYRIGKSIHTEEGKFNASTEFDLTKKSINPMGGFPHYGIVHEDYIMVKGSVTGPRKRVLTLRKTIHVQTSRAAKEQVQLKWIDTSSKLGRGRFQSYDEKQKFLGVMKKDIERERKAAEKKAAVAK